MLSHELRNRIANYIIYALLILALLFVTASIVYFTLGVWVWAFSPSVILDDGIKPHISYFRFALANIVTVFVSGILTAVMAQVFKSVNWLDDNYE